MENDLFITIEFNQREIEGIKEFSEKLDENYNYQIRPIHIPACSEGAEFLMNIFINTSISDFLVGSVVGGITWDLIKAGGKKYIFLPLFDALNKLYRDNIVPYGGLRVQNLKLQFDDCDIIIGGLNKNFTSIIPAIFIEISNLIPKFTKEIGLNVIKIELPMEFLEHYDRVNEKFQIDIFNEEYTIKTFKNLWKVTFETNHPKLIYSFKHKKLFEMNDIAKVLGKEEC